MLYEYIILGLIALYMFLNLTENTKLKKDLDKANTAYRELARDYSKLVNDPYGNKEKK